MPTKDKLPLFQNTEVFAQSLDAADPIQHFRLRYFIPQHNGKDAIYFTGNSLGLQPKAAIDYINTELEDWAALGVMGHTAARNPWVSYHEACAQPLANIVGALPEEVVAMNGLTANIHALFATFYRPSNKRYKIICEAKAFPSDQYALESQCRLHGIDPQNAIIEIAPKAGAHVISDEDILSAIKEHAAELAVVFFGGVNYYTGQVLNIQTITEAAQAAGAFAGFDLAHAAGNIKLQLHYWKVDFACWCSYKYLNSGPGAVAGVYIHQKHSTNTDLFRLAGWWGTNKKERFKMQKSFDPIPTAEGWQWSNAPVLSMAAHKAALQLFEEAGMAALIEKSKLLTSYLFFILDEINSQQDQDVVQLLTPKDSHGCQVSMFMLQKGKEIFDALINEGVIADWREPNVIRIAPVPMYNSFTDVWTFGNIIQSILKRST